MMTPKVNINGTSREALIEQRLEAMRAIREAMTALQETKPHGRDYLGDTVTYERDRATYAERFALLDKLHNDLQDEALAIQNA